jgi:SAM-dependent methyltransferase
MAASSGRTKPTATQLKTRIRSRWALPERVAGWENGGLNVEFADPLCRRRWREALNRGVAGTRLGTALDIGTGPGTIAQLWAELGCRSTGIDFSAGMLEAARRQADERGLKLTLLEGDAEDPPTGKARFDIISSRFVLFTLPHPGYAVRRWVSTLRPGGSLVLIGHEHPDRPGQGGPGNRPQRPGTEAEEKHREALSHLPFVHHKAADLQVVMEAAGLKDIRFAPVTALVSARAALRERNKEIQIPESTPFIVVGRK